MPLYPYTCPKCQTTNTELLPVQPPERLPSGAAWPPETRACPNCGREAQREYSATLHLWDGGYPSKQAVGK